jgi:hypothetical protein
LLLSKKLIVITNHVKIYCRRSQTSLQSKRNNKKAFDFWKDRPNELSQHVNGDTVEDDVKIGIYDEIEDFTVIGWELSDTILMIENSKEKISFDLSEENFKKNKINFKIKKKSFKDICDKKKGFIFTAHERLKGTCGPVEIDKAKNFDKAKLKIIVNKFTLPNSSEIKVIKEISYDKQDISWDLLNSNFDGDGNLPNFEVKKI